MRGTLGALAVAVITGGVLLAELPPSAYKERQAQAPVHLEIFVQSVKARTTREANGLRIDVSVRARVRRVHRAPVPLQPGEVIPIAYSVFRPKEPIAGPSEVPILRASTIVPAYLARDEKGQQYVPAAGGYSFQTVD